MFIHGERAFDTNKEVLGEGACDWVVVKAKSTNDTALVYVGSPDVTVASGDDDLTTGFELAKSEETPKLEVTNLNQIWVVGSAAAGVTFIAKI